MSAVVFDDAGEFPMLLVAMTLNTYGVPGELSVKLMLESKPLGYWLTSCLRVFSDTPKCGVQVFASRNV